MHDDPVGRRDAARSRAAPRRAATVPVGLPGEFRMTALVRGVTARGEALRVDDVVDRFASVGHDDGRRARARDHLGVGEPVRREDDDLVALLARAR